MHTIDGCAQTTSTSFASFLPSLCRLKAPTRPLTHPRLCHLPLCTILPILLLNDILHSSQIPQGVPPPFTLAGVACRGCMAVTT